MKLDTMKVWAVIQAAQAVCQSRNGTDEQATKIAHDRAVDELEQALKAALDKQPKPTPPGKTRKTSNTVNISGRLFHIEKVNSRKWEGYYDDDHSITYDGTSRRELLEEAS